MYDLSAVLPETSVQPGTNLLISGPPLTGKRRVALQLLAIGARNGEGTIIVTTKDSAEKVLSEYESIDPAVETRDVGVVDCVTRQRGVDGTDETDRIRYASSPVDMTGMGIKLSELLEDFYQTRGLQRNRVLLHSISTMLMYAELQTVFRFLHVFTGRIQSADALGVYVIDDSAHDAQTMNTLKQLFDGIVEVSEGDGDEPRISTVGL